MSIIPSEVQRPNGMGFRGIERVKRVHHTTLINWVKQVGEGLPDAYLPEQVPQVGERSGATDLCGLKKKHSDGCGQQ